MQEFITIARVAKTQGRHGEVAAELHTDFPEKFAERKKLFALDADGKRRELRLESHWLHKSYVVLKFAGVESIDTAFIQAGADTVVSSLWELDDSKANTLMKSFYRHLRDEDKTSALRDAEVDLMQENVSPYYWAAFEMVGNPSGSPLNTTNQVAQR